MSKDTTPDTRITAVVQTYNASRHLDACLSCLHGADELLVVDMESTDDTVEIARRHGARVVVVPRGEHRIVEAYRNFAIHEAQNPWVLVVDADELTPKALLDYLRAEIERDPTPRAFLIPIKNYFMGKWMRCYYPERIVRFFYRDGTDWPYRIHSRPTHMGPEVAIAADRTDLAFVHLANEGMSATVEKMNRYTDNEVPRRRASYRRWQFFTDPFFRFFKTFVLKKGFRDGWPGFIHAVQDGVYRFTALAKIEEESRAGRTETDIERDARTAGASTNSTTSQTKEQ